MYVYLWNIMFVLCSYKFHALINRARSTINEYLEKRSQPMPDAWTGALPGNLVHLAFEPLFYAFGEIGPLGADKLRLGPHSI